MVVDEEEKKISKYNEAGFNILRLHNSWMRCADFRSNANYNKWKWELDTVWSELCQDVTDGKVSDAVGIKKTNENLRINIGMARNRNELYEALNARQIFLRELQDKVGKGGIFEDESVEDME